MSTSLVYHHATTTAATKGQRRKKFRMAFLVGVFVVVTLWLHGADLATALELPDLSDCTSGNKTCIRVPIRCVFPACSRVATLQYNSGDPYVTIELVAKLSADYKIYGQYLALGFSKDPEMGEDAVSACIAAPDTRPNVVLSFNSGKQNVDIQTPAGVVTIQDAGILDSYMICRFRQAVRPPATDRKIYSLNSSYNLLLAWGAPTSAADLRLTMHNTDRTSANFPQITAAQVNPTQNKGDVRTFSQLNSDRSDGAVELDNQSATVRPITAVYKGDTAAGDSDPDLGLLSVGDCGQKKGCLLLPASCKSLGDCDSVVSYALADDAIVFELATRINAAQSSDGGRYIAIGFSHDTSMGSDAVTACIYQPKSGSSTIPRVALAYNTEEKQNTVIETPDNYITNEKNVVSGGYLICRFSQKLNPVTKNDKIYSLSKPYHLLLAKGTPASDQALAPHGFDRQDTLNFPTVSGLVNLTAIQSAAVVEQAYDVHRKPLEKAHGILMQFGWWLLIANAILFARYFRNIWPDTQWFDLKVWFQFHRGLNVVGLVLIVAAFICIFVAEKAWVGDSANSRNHAICGLTAVIGAILQPLMALFRCHPGTPKRPIFNWCHRILGVGSWTVAATMWFATGIDKVWSAAETKAYRQPVQGLMIYYWVALGVTIIGLELHITITERISNQKNASLEAFDMSAVPVRTNSYSPAKDPDLKNYASRWAPIRSGFLGFFIISALAVTIAISCLIGLYL